MDISQFRGADGQWSVVAMLLVALGSAVSAAIVLFRLRDKERSEEIAQMKQELTELRDKAEECQSDRLNLHRQIGELHAKLSAMGR